MEVLGDENGVVAERFADGRRDIGIDVCLADSPAHVRDVDPPAVEIEYGATSHVRAIALIRCELAGEPSSAWAAT